MKSPKTIICIVLFIAILAGQVAYGVTTYKDKRAEIASKEEEIRSVQKRIDQLEAKLKMLPETEKQLALLTTEREAMLNKIPMQSINSKETMEIFRYLQTNRYLNLDATFSSTIEADAQGDEIIKTTYMVKYVSTYKDSRKFVENLNSSYQVVNVESIQIGNDVQDVSGEELLAYKILFGDDLNQVVSTNMTFSIFTRADKEPKDEIYQPEMDLPINNEGVFARQGRREDGGDSNAVVGETEKPVVEPTEVPVVVTGSKFYLNIGDRLSSGDTYGLSGPGTNSYIGLSAQTDVHITLNVHANGYELSIEDEDGNVRQIGIDEPIKNPNLEIVSSMRQINEVMPNISVYVCNYTDTVMNVSIRGSLTDNIVIYNAFENRVPKGQTKGNVKLT